MCEFKNFLWEPLQDNRAPTMAKMKTGKNRRRRDPEQGTLLWLMEQSWKLSSTGSRACTQECVRAPTEACRCARPQEPLPCATFAHSVSGSNKETTLILQGVKGGNMLYLLQAVGMLLR